MLALDIYWTSLLILVPCVTLVLGRNIVLRTFGLPSSSTAAGTAKEACEGEDRDVGQNEETEARNFRWLFLRVYLLVMGSEWLQVRK